MIAISYSEYSRVRLPEDRGGARPSGLIFSNISLRKRAVRKEPDQVRGRW